MEATAPTPNAPEPSPVQNAPPSTGRPVAAARRAGPEHPGSTCHLQRPRGVQGAERVAGAQAGALHHVVVGAAEEAVVAQRELVARDELAAAGHAAEALDVVHLGARAHHEVVLAEADAALGALDAVQPARAGDKRGGGSGRPPATAPATEPRSLECKPRPDTVAAAASLSLPGSFPPSLLGTGVCLPGAPTSPKPVQPLWPPQALEGRWMWGHCRAWGFTSASLPVAAG